mgnify:CR=1 FL=1
MHLKLWFQRLASNSCCWCWLTHLVRMSRPSTLAHWVALLAMTYPRGGTLPPASAWSTRSSTPQRAGNVRRRCTMRSQSAVSGVRGRTAKFCTDAIVAKYTKVREAGLNTHHNDSTSFSRMHQPLRDLPFTCYRERWTYACRVRTQTLQRLKRSVVISIPIYARTEVRFLHEVASVVLLPMFNCNLWLAILVGGLGFWSRALEVAVGVLGWGLGLGFRG